MKRRAFAEWVTFGIASAVVLLVMALILVEVPGTDTPPAPVAKVSGEPVRRAGKFFVPVEVRNRGDATAENVQIAATLETGDDSVEADQVVDFLAGGEFVELEFVFADDPASGTLTVEVRSYSVP